MDTRQRSIKRRASDASDLFNLSKDTIRCGCVNAVVRGDGTGNGIRETWILR